jgi:ABC-type phosphate transport system permease subunit
MKRDKIIGAVLLVVALFAISGLALITVFIFREGVPIILRVGPRQFFLSTDWEPSLGHFGILSMMAGSLVVTVGAAVIGVVFSLGLAIVLTQFSPPGLSAALKPVIELLAGIPSVVYGFVGVVTLVPLIRHWLGGPGLSVLAA